MHETPTLCCALAIEERAARKTGLPVARVGVGATLPLPEGPLISFGLCGALVDDLPVGTLVVANRVVDEAGKTLWEGEPLNVDGGRIVTVCGGSSVVDAPDERARLAAATGGCVVDLESAPLARSGRLQGVVRVISDASKDRVGRLAGAAGADGSVSCAALAAAVAQEPRAAIPAALRGTRALRTLSGVRV